MRKLVFLTAIASCQVICAGAAAGVREVKYADPPPWVIPDPLPTEGAVPDGAAFRFVYADQQIRLGQNGMESYTSYRVKILRPEALSAGNVAVSWIPDAGEATVHHVRIIHEQQAVDVLKKTEFQILQREGSLEHAMLNGELTAALQAPGLQVGDELEIAFTVRYRDPTLADHVYGFAALPSQGMPGAFRLRVSWPKGRAVHWRASNDMADHSQTAESDQEVLSYELRDPKTAVTPDGAPPRLKVRRLIEFSDFTGWSDISKRLWPLYEKASKLSADSPIHREIARIATESPDPLKRMEAALQLVQDRVRYVYIGLNGGNMMPASADETWERKFGDCKAKTALLLAILRELNVPAEAVVVNHSGADGINERLPTPAVFDHVLVRAKSGASSYWLDGSRLGDKHLALIPKPLFRWVLPLQSKGADLESVPLSLPKHPIDLTILEIDATRGFNSRGLVKATQVMREDQALQVNAALKGMTAEDAERALQKHWRESDGWIEPSKVSWAYDEELGTLSLTVVGDAKLSWTGSSEQGRRLDIPGAGFTPPAEYHRPEGQDLLAPWVLNFPRYRCWVTAIRLPTDSDTWKWDFYSDPMDLVMGGVRYFRTSDLRDATMRTVMSSRSEVPEITGLQASQVNRDLETFNNNVSNVFQIRADGTLASHRIMAQPPFDAETDWIRNDAPCGIGAKER